MVKFSVCLLLLTVSSGCTRETWRAEPCASVSTSQKSSPISALPTLFLFTDVKAFILSLK